MFIDHWHVPNTSVIEKLIKYNVTNIEHKNFTLTLKNQYYTLNASDKICRTHSEVIACYLKMHNFGNDSLCLNQLYNKKETSVLAIAETISDTL